MRPESQAQDVAFPGQQVVLDVSRCIVSRCRRTMASATRAANSAVSLPPCSMSCSVSLADLEPGLVLLVPLGDAGVEVPAVVVEPRLRGERANLVERLVLERFEADDDVGDLHAGIVDVVLHFDGHAAEAQDPYQRVAQRRVAQMADVRRLVRVDRRVLDDRLARRPRRPRGRRGGCEPRSQERRAIEEDVQVAVRRGLRRGRRLRPPPARRPGPARSPRRLAQAACQLERDGQREVAQRACTADSR